MSQQNLSVNGTPTSARLLTTLLASCWGLSSAYILFHALLVTHDPRPCFAALVPLVIVWATLERKRWGRLALLGLSATALGLFVAAVGFIAAVGDRWLHPAERNLANYAKIALNLYSADPMTALTVLVLAATTGLWLRRPIVIAEFERGKRATLAAAQRAIAMLLVSCWGMTVIFTPWTPTDKNRIALAGSKKATHNAQEHPSSQGAQSHKLSKRPTRSAAPPSNL